MRSRIQYILYALILGNLLLASCSQDDETVMKTVSTNAVAITFDCFTTEDNITRAANGYTGNLTTENKQLYYTGFGVFMAHNNTSAPDIMYNQLVEYVFKADGTGEGYWTYSPIKYWPAQAEGVCFYAYAPYVETPVSLPEGTTGIIGMSANNEATPYISYARAKHPEENVDLLWNCVQVTDAMLTDGRPTLGEPVSLQMKHALARVRISLGITNGSTLNEGEKLLVKRITLTGNFAKTGNLELNHSDATPTWSSQVLADPSTDPASDKTIFIDCHPDANTDSYGIIAEGARYIEGLPVSWQPSGLPHTNYDASNDDLKDNKTNLLCMGDALSYLYLIPQDDLSFTCVLDFCKLTSGGDITHFSKTTNAGDTPIHITPLNGNKTYEVVLKITL